MRAIAAVLVVVVVQLAAHEAFGASASPVAGPRVVLGVDSKAGRRYVQLTDRGGPVYPTADVTCDGNRRTITLIRRTASATGPSRPTRYRRRSPRAC
jgi:hypothetical protein